MPMVIIMALVAGIMAAVLLERQANQRQVVERQIASYKAHHFERGIREVVGQWTDTLLGQPLEKLVDEDGHALDLELPGGGLAAVYIYDGQGTAMSEPTGLNEEEQQDAAGVLQALADLTGGNVDPSWLRPVGPVRVSAATAPQELLEAIGSYASGGRAGRRFAKLLVEARNSATLTQADVQKAITDSGITAEEQAIVTRLVTAKPELWAMVVDVYDPEQPQRDGGPSVRYGGRFLLPTSGGARVTTALQSLGKFVSWEELPIR